MTVLSQSAATTGERTSTPRGDRRTGRTLLPGTRIAYVYILPFFLVFAAFSIYPWIATAWV